MENQGDNDAGHVHSYLIVEKQKLKADKENVIMNRFKFALMNSCFWTLMTFFFLFTDFQELEREEEQKVYLQCMLHI